MVDRGHLGTMPLGAERDDDSYLDFVEGVRTFTLAKMSPVVTEKSNDAVAEYEARTGQKVASIEQVREALDPVPVVATRNRFARTVQEMMWDGVIETYRKREDELLRELAVADRSGPGSVEYDPNFQQPDYFSKVEFHIQPGNYHADPLAGYIYHYGTKVFFTGRNNNDDVQRSSVMAVPMPKDGVVRRVLDQACSVGQSSTAWKERFPEAEVWGIDAGAPMVRYAHKRAIDMGLDVNFAQRLAENSKFPDNHFDVVWAFILYHEIPPHIMKQVIRETHRVLRPGGVYAIVDFVTRGPNHRASNPASDYFRDFDTHDNGEPYASDFVYSDFHGELRKVFSEVIEHYEPAKTFLPMRVCYK
ncbi:MAG: class I SAM-dependent methyltransferase [Dehalococcoidia bacterium]